MRNVGQLDYGPASTVSADLSDQITFREGEDLISCSIEANAELFASSARIAGSPGSDSGGAIDWRNISAIRKYGYLQETVLAVAFSGVALLAKLGKVIVTERAATAVTAKQLVIMRTASNADLWREGDTVRVNSRSLGLNNVPVVIMSYTFTEGSAEQTVIVDQYPLSDPLHAWSRYLSGLSYMAQAFQNRP
jgi:hypothetical protein